MASNADYQSALEVLLTQLGKMKALPDANLEFVIGVETQVVEELRSPERAMQRAGLIPTGPANPHGMGQFGGPAAGPGGMGSPGGMSAPAPSFAGAGNSGSMQTAPPSNPNELSRILNAGG